MEQPAQQGIHFASGAHRLLGTMFFARGDAPKPTALVLHGIPGIEKNHDIAHALREAGWNALIFHYRGCWGSEGPYRIATFPADVAAALAYLRGGAHRRVDARRLVLIGHSGGGWAAVLAAAADPEVRGVAVYGALAEPRRWRAEASFFQEEVVPFVRGATAADLVRELQDAPDALSARLAAHRIPPRPMLVIHGARDEAVPIEHGRALADAAGVDLQTHPDADHSFAWHRPWLRERILGWLRTLPD